MVITRSLFFAGIVITLCLLGQHARADTITNGDFQTGTLSGWTVFTTGSNGTTGSGLPTVVSFNTTGGGASDAAHFNVGQVSINNTSQQGGGLMQTINAPVTGFYTLTESFASQEGAGGGNEDAGTFSIIIDGTTVATDALGFISGSTTDRGSFNEAVDLTAGSHTFETEITRVFLSNVGDTPDQYIDNISLTPNSVATTPEPSTLFLLGTGLVGIAGMARRRIASRR